MRVHVNAIKKWKKKSIQVLLQEITLYKSCAHGQRMLMAAFVQSRMAGRTVWVRATKKILYDG